MTINSFTLLFFLNLLNSFSAISQVNQQWVQHALPGSYSVATSVEVFGNSVYVLGYSNGDIQLIKYSKEGQVLWTRSYNGPENGAESSASMTFDATGNIYVVGTSQFNVNGLHIVCMLTLKYNSSGQQQWVARYIVPLVQTQSRDVSIDTYGNVYVTGIRYGVNIPSDYITIKYNSSGVEQWVRTYDGTANGNDYAFSVAVDVSGNVIVGGTSEGEIKVGFLTVDTYTDFLTIKYDPSGNVVWTRRYGGVSYEYFRDLFVDVEGNILVTGSSTSGTNTAVNTIKYDAGGTVKWTSQFNTYFNNSPAAFKVDLVGNVYITGFIQYGVYQPSYGFVLKYDSTGQYKWMSIYTAQGGNSTMFNVIELDGYGNIYVAGKYYQSNGVRNYITLKYLPLNGSNEWAVIKQSPNTYDDVSSISSFTPAGPLFQNASIFVTGRSFNNSNSNPIWTLVTVCYTQPLAPNPFVAPMSISPRDREFTESFSLTNYPNPFNATTQIEYTLPEEAIVTLKIFDMGGREVMNIAKEKKPAGLHRRIFSAADLPKGNYTCIINIRSAKGERVLRRKMILQ